VTLVLDKKRAFVTKEHEGQPRAISDLGVIFRVGLMGMNEGFHPFPVSFSGFSRLSLKLVR
jgi:hypothetical protein